MTERTLPGRLRDLAAMNRTCFPDEAATYLEAADALDAKSALLAEAETALQAVEDWWLADGMKFHTGAPCAIFATRTVLAKLKAENAKPAPQPEG